MKRLIYWLLGIHLHTWTKWEDDHRVYNDVVQHRQCKTCGLKQKHWMKSV